MIKEIKYNLTNTFSEIKFDESSHSYTIGDNFLVSTSEFIKSFTKPYDSYMMSNILAKSYNNKHSNCEPRTNKYYLSRWEDIKKAALYQGTKVHNYAMYNYPHFNDAPDCVKECGVVEFFSDLDNTRYEVVCMELKMYIKQFLRAGTTDLVILDKLTNTLIIGDWKTGNKDIFSSYKEKKMLEPFENFYDNNYNKYSLQLSDYKNMIEMNTDYKVSDLWLIHLIDKEFEEKPNYNRQVIDSFMNGKYYKAYRAIDFSENLKLQYTKLIVND